ncbi:cyclopropane-fatty-acyl-phospholipid synthase [Colletotrichum tofieldiae]|nr:cyclopropane-fatty-acyl-phospholipid synthase [Colletotrichum tofieldiae]
MSAANPGLRPLTFLAGFAYYSLLGGRLDTALLLLFSAIRSKQALTDLVSDYINPQTLRHQLLLLPGFLLGFVILQVCRFLLGLAETGDSTKWTAPMRPLLIPCTTTHRRTFPEKHAFAYSYLVVGIPVGWRGTYAGMVSSGVETPGWTSWFSVVPRPGKGWFDVNPADYLDRGNGHLGLRGKLDAYLESQGADPAQYPRAYLVTAARFMGYHFNPVSFWYLYSKDEELTAMVLEVNNTFGERRMYFLATDAIPSEQRLDGGDNAEKDASGPAPKADEELVVKKSTPRRSRAYTLDNTITLKSSKDHPKIVARLFNSGPAIDPGSMSFLQKLAFLCRWWWVGFVTFPRIVKEAAVLFFSRRLHVWYRPEPLKESLGRQADATESRLEPIFRAYLGHLVEQSAAAIAVKYIPAGIDSAGPEVMQSPAAKKNPKRTEELDFKVLTPAFYTRFVHYAHDLEAVCCEFQDNSTIWISRPDLLPKLILKKPTPPLKTTNILDFVYFRAIRALRQRPERIERPLTSAASPSGDGRGGVDGVQKVDIRDFRISSMDGFVLGHSDAQTRSAYRSLVLRTFLANRLALGSVELLGLQHFVLRAGVAWVLSSLVAPLVRL